MGNVSRKKLVEVEAVWMRTTVTGAPPGKLSTLGISFGMGFFQRRLQISLHGECKKTESQVERFHILWPFGLILVKN